MVKIILVILVLSNCSQKEYVKVDQPPHEFQKLEQVERYTIRVHPDDVVLFNLYRGLLHNHIDFYEKQIDDYYLSYERLHGKKYTMLEDDEIKNP